MKPGDIPSYSDSPEGATPSSALGKENEKKQKERLKALEQEIHDLEEKIKLLELKMADPTLYENTDKMLDVQQEYDNNKNRLEGLYLEWMDLA